MPPSRDADLSSMGLRLRTARKRARATQEQLALVCGVTRAAVAQWELGTTNPTISHLQKAALMLNTNAAWLLGEKLSEDNRLEIEPPRTDRRIPVIDYRLAANLEQERIKDGSVIDFLRTENLLSQKAFALLITDESLAPEVRRGDRVIVDPQVTAQPGDYIVAHVLVDDEAIVRKYRPRGKQITEIETVELAPINPDWPTIIIGPNNPGRIIGTIVELRRNRSNFR